MGVIPQELIEKSRYWTKALSLVEGCTPVSKACDNCWCAQAAYIRQHQKNPKIRKQYSDLTYIKNEIPTFNGTIRVREDRLNEAVSRLKMTAEAV